MEVEMNSTSINMGSIEEEHTSNIASTSQPQQNLPCGDLIDGNRQDYFNICVPLYHASITGDWKAAEVILRDHSVPHAITENYDAALHVAASAEENKLTERFVKNLVDRMNIQDLELENKSGNTALCIASAAGHTKMVMTMVNKNNKLLDIPDRNGEIPLYTSALHGRYETVKYLHCASINMTGEWWTHERRCQLLEICIECDFFDVAHNIVKNRPELANELRVLRSLARKADALNRAESMNYIWRIIDSIFGIIQMKVAVGSSKMQSDAALTFLSIIWNNTIRRMPRNEVDDILRGPPDPTNSTDETPRYSSRTLFVAAEMGNTKFIVNIIRAYPDLIWKVNDDKQTIFHTAVIHRHQGIYNLLYEIGSMRDQIMDIEDKDNNNMLHLVGMTSVKMRSQTSGASLLMQRELLWFKEVEKMLPPAYREKKNKAGQTPYELFSEENKDLVSKGLNWMKDCMVVATLIVTVAFAVAFTVPGGYKQDKGLPVFIHRTSFLVFVIADAISLFSSSTSLLVFLSILTSRHGQRDFMYSLPRKLMIGLVTLFISVAAMMLTFSASFFVLYRNTSKWVPILIATFAAMPVIIFAVLQFPLLVDMFRSMYDYRYLFNPRRRVLYSKNFKF